MTKDKEEFNAYWRKREKEHNVRRIKEEKQIVKRLKSKYYEAMDEIQKEIEGFYGRYATKEGISIAEARKRVSKIDIEAYGRKAKKYVKEKNFTDIANQEMRLYNVTMKINRIELLKKNIELELLALYSEEERNFEEELSKYAREEFQKNAGILADSVYKSEKHIKNVVNSSFMTANWSDNIWTHQNALRAELDKLLNRGITQGVNPRVLARDLRKQFDTSVYNSERLLITEFARVQKDVFVESMEDAGIEHYEYITQTNPCNICAKLDGQIFRIDKAEIGKNMYPMHPFCRCSSSGHVSRVEMERDFRERGLIDDE